jgi:hypothetical protein
LNEARLFDPIVSGGVFTGGTFDGPQINSGTIDGSQINNATIDCNTTVCTQPDGTCNDTVASTAFVCDAISDAIDGGNPDFCNAVNACLGIVTDLCTQVGICINTVPNIIANPAAFDPATYATDAVVGVTRFATLGEVQAATCELAIDPCTLGAFWSAGGPNALWTAFEAAVSSVVMGGAIDFCAATAACGYQVAADLCADVLACGFQTQAALCADVTACGFAPLNNPVFTGDPQAPTPLPGDNDNSIATTAFVTAAVAGFGGGPGGTVLARAGNFRVVVSGGIGPLVTDVFAFRVGCTAVVAPASIVVTFNVQPPSANYSVVSGGGIAIVGGAPADGIWADIAVGNKTVAGFTIAFFASALAPNIGDVYFDFAVIG